MDLVIARVILPNLGYTFIFGSRTILDRVDYDIIALADARLADLNRREVTSYFWRVWTQRWSDSLRRRMSIGLLSQIMRMGWAWSCWLMVSMLMIVSSMSSWALMALK